MKKAFMLIALLACLALLASCGGGGGGGGGGIVDSGSSGGESSGGGTAAADGSGYTIASKKYSAGESTTGTLDGKTMTFTFTSDTAGTCTVSSAAMTMAMTASDNTYYFVLETTVGAVNIYRITNGDLEGINLTFGIHGGKTYCFLFMLYATKAEGNGLYGTWTYPMLGFSEAVNEDFTVTRSDKPGEVGKWYCIDNYELPCFAGEGQSAEEDGNVCIGGNLTLPIWRYDVNDPYSSPTFYFQVSP